MEESLIKLPDEFQTTPILTPPAAPQIVLPIPPVNPLLARARLPGETHRLPSGGTFYKNGELDENVENGEVHIHSMTAIDEILMSSTAKLFSGEAYVEVIGRCVPSVKNPKKLLAQDIDFILLCLRKISYGPTFDFTKRHYGCSAITMDDEGNLPPPEDQVHQINMSKIISSTKYMDPTTLNTKYRVTLGNGQLLRLEPIRFDDYIKLRQLNSTLKSDTMSIEQKKDMFLTQASSIIAQVDEVTDREMIRGWLEVISPAEIKNMNKAVTQMSTWGVNTTVEVKCQHCGEVMEVDVPTNPLARYS